MRTHTHTLFTPLFPRRRFLLLPVLTSIYSTCAWMYVHTLLKQLQHDGWRIMEQVNFLLASGVTLDGWELYVRLLINNCWLSPNYGSFPFSVSLTHSHIIVDWRRGRRERKPLRRIHFLFDSHSFWGGTQVKRYEQCHSYNTSCVTQHANYVQNLALFHINSKLMSVKVLQIFYRN